jgi:hypothetical protein
MNKIKKWDIPLGQPVTYFDPELSYELTKYRPITMTKGLDFDPTPFTIPATSKKVTGRYTNLPIGSKSHKDWWSEELRRCKEGYEYNGYRVTGDHYFFLNYYILMNVKNLARAGQGRTETQPDFWAKHYEYFHYIEMCEILGRDVIAFKSRGVGFSEIAVCLGVRPYTTTPDYQAVYIAFSENLLEPTLSKAWNQMEYLNAETETAFKRLRMKIDTNMHKKASIVDAEKNEKGHKAELKGVIVDNSRKLRGRRIDRLIFEESGSNPILIETYIKGQALVEILGEKIGTRVVFGTGGDEGPPLAGLEKMFLNVESFNGLPYRHNHTRDGQYTMTGYFLPAYACVIRFMDKRGVTDEHAARQYYENERKKLAHLPKELMDYCAEYCFFPEEALNKQGQNNFNQVLLAQQYTEIQIHKTTPKPERGYLFWNKDSQDNVIGVRWVKDPNGPIEIIEHPVDDPETKAPKKNMYVAGVDSIDHGTDDSVVGEKGSKFAILIKKRQTGLSGNLYVAKYIERPSDVRIAYTNAAMMLWYYGCKANVEDTKISFRTWLREKKLDTKMLMARPQFAINPNKKKGNTGILWGTPGSEKMIMHGLNLIATYIEDEWNKIFFIDLLEQLQKFSYENKGEFDLVMAMVYTEIGDEDMYDLKIDQSYRTPDTWDDVGYFIDPNTGYKQWGVIPKEQNTISVKINDKWYKTTN